LGPPAGGCSSRRRANTAGSAESQTPSEVSSCRALPGAPSARRARTAAAVGSEAWGEVSVPSGAAAALVLARVRGPSAVASRLMWVTSSSRGSRTDDRQWSRHCWVAEDRVAFPPRAGVASAMRGKIRRLARASHVCSRPKACRRQVRAWAQLEEAAMGTRSAWGCAWPAVGGCQGPEGAAWLAASLSFLAASAASTAEGHLGPGHLDPTADSSVQARHTRRFCGLQPAAGRGGARGQMGRAEVAYQGLHAAPSSRRSPPSARAPRHGTKPHARRVGRGCGLRLWARGTRSRPIP